MYCALLCNFLLDWDEDDEGEAIFTHHLYFVAFCSSIAHSWIWL